MNIKNKAITISVTRNFCKDEIVKTRTVLEGNHYVRENKSKKNPRPLTGDFSVLCFV